MWQNVSEERRLLTSSRPLLTLAVGVLDQLDHPRWGTGRTDRDSSDSTLAGPADQRPTLDARRWFFSGLRGSLETGRRILRAYFHQNEHVIVSENDLTNFVTAVVSTEVWQLRKPPTRWPSIERSAQTLAAWNVLSLASITAERTNSIYSSE